MSRKCTTTFYIANLLAFIVAVPVFVTGCILLANSERLQCKQQQYPQLLEKGSFMIITCLLAMIGVSYRLRKVLWIYLIIVVLRTVLHIYMMIVVIDSTYNEKAFTKNYNSGEIYKIEDFSGVAKIYIEESEWDSTRACIIKSDSCRRFDYFYSSMSQEDFMKKFPVVWGCCQPPESCKYHYEGEMIWSLPETGIQSNNTDCYKYLNNHEVLCTNCDTCKAGFLASVYGRLFKIVIASSILLGVYLFMIITGVMVIREIPKTEEIK